SRNGNYAAPILQNEGSWHFDLGVFDANLSFASEELRVGAVVANRPTGILGLNANSAQWIENLKQAYIFVSFAVDDGKRVIGHIGIDGNMFFICRIPGKEN